MAFTYATALRNAFFRGNDAKRKPKNHTHGALISALRPAQNQDLKIELQ